MMNKEFSSWMKWDTRNNVQNIEMPGIYTIAISDEDISGQKFNWLKKIKYIGMTVAVTGLKGRLYAFDRTIFGKYPTHGGADRFRCEHQNYDELVKKIYVAVLPFKCNVKSKQSEDLRVMGEVVKCEYDCFAEYFDEYQSLPKFNMKKSEKYSLTYGRGKLPKNKQT